MIGAKQVKAARVERFILPVTHSPATARGGVHHFRLELGVALGGLTPADPSVRTPRYSSRRAR